MTFTEFVDQLRERGLYERMQQICRFQGVLLEEVFDLRGTGSTRFARGRIWCWLVDDCHKTHSEVARMFGRKEMATVRDAVKTWRLRHKKPGMNLVP